MPYYLTELYTPKPAWISLGEDGRRDFFDTVGAAMPALSSLGIEPVALGKVDRDRPHSAPQAFSRSGAAPTKQRSTHLSPA